MLKITGTTKETSLLLMISKNEINFSQLQLKTSIFYSLNFNSASNSNFNATVKATHLFDVYNVINNFTVVGIDEGQFVIFEFCIFLKFFKN